MRCFWVLFLAVFLGACTIPAVVDEEGVVIVPERTISAEEIVEIATETAVSIAPAPEPVKQGATDLIVYGIGGLITAMGLGKGYMRVKNSPKGKIIGGE